MTWRNGLSSDCLLDDHAVVVALPLAGSLDLFAPSSMTSAYCVPELNMQKGWAIAFSVAFLG